MKKKKLIVYSLFLILTIFLVKSCTKNNISYKITNDNITFSIEEKNLDGNYYIEIKSKKHVYPIRVSGVNGKKIINNIYYYKDTKYECILPIIKTKVIFDMMCFKDDILYNYYDIKGIDSALDSFVSKIKSYNFLQFSDNLDLVKNVSDTVFYTSNDIDKDVYITSYKGLTNINKSIQIFENDVYNNILGTFLNDYYVVPDYNNTYEFEYIYVINLKNHKISKLKSKDSISFDSYIQGIVDNKIYLYDRNNEKQYEIDIARNHVHRVSSGNDIMFYKNGKWKNISIASANKGKYFELMDSSVAFKGFYKSIKYGNYYYLFKQYGDEYELYRVDENNISVKKYLMRVPNLNVYFKDDYLYYVNGDILYYYSDITGNRAILKNNELNFNKTIKYYIY